MVHDVDYFSSYTKYDKPQYVYLGDNSTLAISGTDTVGVLLPNDQTCLVPDVLHIPGLTKNLFSIKQLDLSVARSLHIANKVCTLHSVKGDEIATCKLAQDLYKLGDVVKSSSIIVATATTVNSSHRWHSHLGHVHQ